MEKYHKQQIYLKIEELLDTGIAQFSDRELKRAFDQHRMSKNVWRGLLDLINEFEDLASAENEVTVLRPINSDGFLVILQERTNGIHKLKDLI